MRQILFFLLLFFIIAYTAYSSTDSASIYNEANKFYAQGEYQKALDLYRELIDRRVKNPYLFYNIGNTYFKLGNLGYARIFFERALLLKPFDRDIRNNLKYVTGSLKDRILPLYSEGLFRALSTVSSLMTFRIMAFIELFFFTAFIILFHGYIFIPPVRNKIKNYIYVAASLFIIFLIATFSYQAYEKNHPKGIVVEKEIDIMNAPIPESEPLFSLHEGTKAKLIEKRGEWIRISIADGREGWTIVSYIEFIISW